MPATLENILLHWFSNYDSCDDVEDKAFYRGPPKNISACLVRQKTEELDVLEFSQWIVSHIPVDRFKPPHGHINCFTFEKMKTMLETAKFTMVHKKSYCQSVTTYFQENKFDNPLRKKFSLYIEAYKK